MDFNRFIGIDISKATLDLSQLTDGAEIVHDVCANNCKDITATLKALISDSKGKILICAEHTGMYCYPLIKACHQLKLALWLENPLTIKKCSGLIRGKNDQIDAIRIASYAYRYVDKARIYEPQDDTLQRINELNREREMYVIDRGKYKAQINDQKEFLDKSIYTAKANRLKAFIQRLTQTIKLLEKEIEKLISSSHEIKNQFDNIISINGIGPQTAIQTIIATKAFRSFNSPRKFCCHAGVAPFASFSGTSQKSRWKVSHQANKQLKKLYHMAALSVIQIEGDLQQYYLRKVKEGKNKMSVINAIRSKLIHRVFAVIRDNRKYEKNYTHELA